MPRTPSQDYWSRLVRGVSWESIVQKVPRDTYYLNLKKHTLAQMLVRSEHSTSRLLGAKCFLAQKSSFRDREVRT